MRQAWRVLAVLALCLMLPMTLSAGIITYSGFDEGVGGPPHPLSDVAAAAFDAATGYPYIITFESQPLGVYTSLDLGKGVTLTGTNYYSADQQIINTPWCDPALCGYNTTFGGSQWADVYGGTITFTFANPTHFFGAYFTGMQVPGIGIAFNDGSDQFVPIPAGAGGTAFVGFTDSNTFTSVTIVGLNDIIGVDDVRVVPEPEIVVLLGSGLLGALGVLRRKLF